MKELFKKIAERTSYAIGTPWAFIIALFILIIWAVSGPFLKFSDTWQLVINTGTTIVTFLTVFLIQNAQNRSDKATQIKLDALIRATKGAKNKLIDVEEETDEEMEKEKEEIENPKRKKRKKKLQDLTSRR